MSLLTYCDDIVNKDEKLSVSKIGLKMTLNPSAVDYVLKIMQRASNHIIAPGVVVCNFK